MIIGITFAILHKNICCDPSSEPSPRDGSDEGSQHMVSTRNKKNYPLIIIKYSLLSRARILHCQIVEERPKLKWQSYFPC